MIFVFQTRLFIRIPNIFLLQVDSSRLNKFNKRLILFIIVTAIYLPFILSFAQEYLI
uniref:Uncharacterized protein n=1 Tax=Moumouvirus sp. 'Monve' TaxID=1128131 RepID=H2ED79_9VIRU|nr:hypothetical protein mv_R147 [Moumouvirus Monve]